MAVSQTLLRQLGFTLLNRATSRPRPMLASSLSAAGRVPGRQSGYYGRDDARPATERVDPSQQRWSLEAAARE